MTRILADAAQWVSGDLFGSKSIWPDADDVLELCQKRLLICDECKIADGFNYDNVKKWTSEAPVTMKGRTGYLAQTATITSNNIPFYEKSAMNNSIGRRMVVYHMCKPMTKQKKVYPREVTNMVSLSFMSLAVSVAAAFERPPTSLAIALYTFFRKNVNKMTAGYLCYGYTMRYNLQEALPGVLVMLAVAGHGQRTGDAVHKLDQKNGVDTRSTLRQHESATMSTATSATRAQVAQNPMDDPEKRMDNMMNAVTLSKSRTASASTTSPPTTPKSTGNQTRSSQEKKTPTPIGQRGCKGSEYAILVRADADAHALDRSGVRYSHHRHCHVLVRVLIRNHVDFGQESGGRIQTRRPHVRLDGVDLRDVHPRSDSFPNRVDSRRQVVVHDFGPVHQRVFTRCADDDGADDRDTVTTVEWSRC
ncbi:hypothetical protein HYALB_00000322 [Hymenoscyphus albidus]|uniref:Uncharacterized protein n=1 Tax=Hymenoscyphus albidus TaxID=595503 RepID=A0A9N9Q981_9HELO|nr:hypothetical protein HYALB_00000322 [Hymenoscyphus albidus]